MFEYYFECNLDKVFLLYTIYSEYFSMNKFYLTGRIPFSNVEDKTNIFVNLSYYLIHFVELYSNTFSNVIYQPIN